VDVDARLRASRRPHADARLRRHARGCHGCLRQELAARVKKAQHPIAELVVPFRHGARCSSSTIMNMVAAPRIVSTAPTSSILANSFTATSRRNSVPGHHRSYREELSRDPKCFAKWSPRIGGL
jgi:hypothetical protein